MISDSKYKEIVENANSIILLMNNRGGIIFLNQFGQRFFGYRDTDILGENVIGTIVPQSNSAGEDLDKMIKKILGNPQEYSINENENMRSNGERVHVLWTNKAIIGYDASIQEILCIGNQIKK
ncbi:MAG TPA: PAS domain S-box protein [Candidatus Omnitrophota bacterium]|nr:PAS domain S-box protein [Candidatus Omnitrophota bacterium]HPT38903.1 PAS domain S-box protein [Candidatus Omnitrophota bacterium]